MKVSTLHWESGVSLGKARVKSLPSTACPPRRAVETRVWERKDVAFQPVL